MSQDAHTGPLPDTGDVPSSTVQQLLLQAALGKAEEMLGGSTASTVVSGTTEPRAEPTIEPTIEPEPQLETQPRAKAKRKLDDLSDTQSTSSGKSNSWKDGLKAAREVYRAERQEMALRGETVSRPANLASVRNGEDLAEALEKEDPSIRESVLKAYNSYFDENHRDRAPTKGSAPRPTKTVRKERFQTDKEDWNYTTAWAPGRAGSAKANADGHYAKHGAESDAFTYGSAKEYTKAALSFWEDNSSKAVPQEGGKTVIYDLGDKDHEGKMLVYDVTNKLLTFHALSRETIRRYQSDGNIATYVAKKVMEL